VISFLARILIVLVLAIAVPLSVGAQEPVRVASKIDAEGALLGHLIIALLDANGIATVDRLRLGPTVILRRAILAGEIDLYPEYTGNGAFFHAKDRDPAWKDAAAGYGEIKALDAPLGLVWLAPAPADNSWVIAVRGDVARTNRLASMEDFGRWVSGGGKVELAASAEFVESPAALPALERSYGFTLDASRLLILVGGNTTATIRAAAEGISGVNAAMAYGTDGALAVLDLAVMRDSRGAEIVYAPAPVIRASVLERHPEIARVLAPVFASLDLATLRRLNAAITADGEDAATVARDYLKAKGFLR
jgi:osmoprotectant transport system substrate-binding protein